MPCIFRLEIDFNVWRKLIVNWNLSIGICIFHFEINERSMTLHVDSILKLPEVI